MLKYALEDAVSAALGLKAEILYPPKGVAADYATNAAFGAQKDPKTATEEFRQKLLADRAIGRMVQKIDIVNGFLNFTLSRKFLAAAFQKFDPRRIGRKRPGTILVEYSSPNIGKPLSIAHIRSTIIGDALSRIYRALGYKVITDNHLGDLGLQMGVLIAACKLWAKKPVRDLTLAEALELYVRFNAEMKTHEELAAKARMETILLQQGDRKTLAVWKSLVRKSAAEYRRLYGMLGVKFDLTLGESFYRKSFPKTVANALENGVAEKSQGAIVIPFEANEPPLIIQKQDGGYLYGTFDLATIEYRMKKWDPALILYVISNEQALYLSQVFRAGEKFGWIKAGQAAHVKFGLLLGEDLKRLSTRQGKAILLEDVIREAAERARKVVEEKNPSLAEREKETISRMVGIGALKYNDLSQNRNTDIVFDWDRMLDFGGNSAPYLQYTFARLRAIVRKSGERKINDRSIDVLDKPEEIALMKKVLQFPEAVGNAAKEYLPNLVANYLWELANLANTFYEKYPVLKAAKDVRASRLALIAKTADTLKTGLSLLGIEAPERV